MVWAVLAGLGAAFTTLAFRELLHGVQFIATGQTGGLVAAAMALPAWQRVLVPTLGGLAAGVVLIWARRQGSGRTGTDYMEAIAIGDGLIPTRASLLRSVSCALSVGTGASIGREGPMIQLAALVGSWLARAMGMDEARRRMLVACGAAAGIATAYNAPIAGALFVAEIVLGSIAMASLGPLILASVTASVVAHQLLGFAPTYHMPAFAPVGLTALPGVALLGLVAGVAAPLFLGLLEAGKRLFTRIKAPVPVRLALAGLVVGLLSIQMPQVWGNGYSVVNAILNQPWTWAALLWVLVGKLLATTATVGSGTVGGVFTPTLFVGATLGALVAHVLALLAPGSADASLLAAVGMGALLAATTHAPLMAIVMILEMTASDQMGLPLMLACVLAYSVARLFGVESVYSQAIRREAAEHPRRPLEDWRIRDLLQSERDTLRPSASLHEVDQIFGQRRVQYLYVTQDDGCYLGAVSLHDVRQRSVNDASIHAGDCLVPAFPVLHPDMRIHEALGRFAHHHGERLPVVESGASGMLLGSVRKTDLLLLLSDQMTEEPTAAAQRPHQP